MVSIIVVPRPQTRGPGDFHASLEGNTKIWGCGKNSNEAIGDLVRTHGDQFNLQIKEPVTP